ncbi:Inosine/uridine-preferring nucleoside hydrolase domain-containing protein [Xylogone sp. PMI_703]|nr:Inosine/uridine-preferring nucleoside hydrolase domain-containing protein [Xylogone sp. PMI_703]
MAEPSVQRVPVWLDCDPGHDDAFAMLFAAYHPNIKLLGISTVHGNSSVAHTTSNALSVLTAMGQTSIPVFPGSKEGLVRPAVHAPAIHGESGLDGSPLLPPPAVGPAEGVSYVDAITSALLATPPSTAWLIATGALTNVARVFQAYPELAFHIKGLSIMGGAIGDGFTSAKMGKVDDELRIGNWSPWAEFNILVDPEAAAYLFKHPELKRKTVMIPLDVTHQVLATKEVQELLLFGKQGKAVSRSIVPGREGKSILRLILFDLLTFFAKTYADVFGIVEGPPLHDPLAVAVILDGIQGAEIPFYDIVDDSERRTERYEVEVITAGTLEEAQLGSQLGRTIVKLLPEGQEGVKIPRGLDVKRFWTVLEECVESADEVNLAKGIL